MTSTLMRRWLFILITGAESGSYNLLTCGPDTVSLFIQRKKINDVIDKIIFHWIGMFGFMGANMTDNGGTFSSE